MGEHGSKLRGVYGFIINTGLRRDQDGARGARRATASAGSRRSGPGDVNRKKACSFDRKELPVGRPS
jgi:hypothetical protein